MRAAIITISTSKAQGAGEDESGPLLRELAERSGTQIIGEDLIADDRQLIQQRLLHWVEVEKCSLVLTTGGTGLAPDDVTPEATGAIIEREVPGITEAMRAASQAHTPYWMLSRGIAGIRGSTLIINFPGSPTSIQQSGRAIVDALPHALALITERTHDH
jgi:molybdopterin adenylyltransferase